ncbi:MAG: hypothetical protein IJ375_05740 [Oscillospiraceae bacterium]|nr:hypothetical protein [Oscillospiraceae bacterium]
MKSRSWMTGTAAAVGMLVLILDGRTAMEGIRDGMDLCLRTLIPSLFPFFILSMLLTGSMAGQKLPLLRPIGRLCGIPEGCESLLITGFLGGYPVGAQNIAQAWKQGALSQKDAERMLGFCSNAGPAFIFGVVGLAFDVPWLVWALWAVHMVSAIAVGTLIPSSCGRCCRMPKRERMPLTRALQKSIAVMAQVCGWVVLFRMVLAYLDRWFLWLLPEDGKVFLSGLLELSNGCVGLGALEMEGARFLAATVLLAFGGVCVTLQTGSVTGGLSLRYYFPGKLLQAVFSLALSFGIQLCLPAEERCALPPLIWAAAALISLISMGFLRKRQNNSSIPAAVGV